MTIEEEATLLSGTEAEDEETEVEVGVTEVVEGGSIEIKDRMVEDGREAGVVDLPEGDQSQAFGALVLGQD